MTEGDDLKSGGLDQEAEVSYQKANQINEEVLVSLVFDIKALTPRERKEFEGFILRGINLYDADLCGVMLRLDGKDLTGTNLKGAKLSNIFLRGTDFTGANLERVTLRAAMATNAVLENANLKEANLYGICLDESNLTNVNLEDAHLSAVGLNIANLTKAHLKGCQFIAGTMRSAILMDTDFEGSALNYTFLNHSDLRTANFKNATMKNVCIDGAYLPPSLNINEIKYEEDRENITKIIFKKMCEKLGIVDKRETRIIFISDYLSLK